MSFDSVAPAPRALDAVGAVDRAVTELADAPLWALSDEDALEGWLKLEQVQRRLDAALSEGAVSREQAQVITRALDRLPTATSVETVREAERTLVEQAAQLDARQLAIAGQQLRRHVDPDAEDRLFAEQQAARDRNWFSMSSDPDRRGGPIAGWLDAEGQAQLAAALSPLAAPCPDLDGGRDPRSARRRRGDGLVELARQACNSGALPGERMQAPHVIVTMSLDTLLARTDEARAFLDDGTAVSAAEARRIACDAQLVPVVLGANGEPLDVGRARRPVTAAIRRALVARDGGCAQPSCGRPAVWTDAHHIVPWSQGGDTSVANCVLLCEVQAPPWHRAHPQWMPTDRRRPDGSHGPPP